MLDGGYPGFIPASWEIRLGRLASLPPLTLCFRSGASTKHNVPQSTCVSLGLAPFRGVVSLSIYWENYFNLHWHVALCPGDCEKGKSHASVRISKLGFSVQLNIYIYFYSAIYFTRFHSDVPAPLGQVSSWNRKHRASINPLFFKWSVYAFMDAVIMM